MTTYRHVLALNPYFRNSNAATSPFPPTGLEYIAANVKDLVGKVTLLDLRYETAYQNPQTINAFLRSEIDLLCISIRWEARFREVCDFVSQLAPEVTTIIGGYQATAQVEYLFERCPNVHGIVRGEGEEVIRQIARGTPWEDIRGLSWRRNGEIVHNEIHPLPDITQLAYADRSLRRHDYYFTQYGVRLGRFTFDTILTTRGCPFKCKFCTFSLNPLGQKRDYTERPLDSVMEELSTITADIVLFSDDNLFTNPQRAEKLCDLILESKIRKAYVVQARVDVARHRTLLDKAWAAGFRMFLLGVESPHDRILNQLHKGITQQQIREAFAVLTQYDFFLHGYFIYGNIGETKDEMLYIPTFAKEIGCDSISYEKLRIERYSPLKDVVDRTPGYYYEKLGGPVYSDHFGRKELKQIGRALRHGFYDLPQILHLLRKARRLGLLDGPTAAGTLLKLPLLLYKVAERRVQKRRYRRQRHLRAQEAVVTPVVARQ